MEKRIGLQRALSGGRFPARPLEETARAVVLHDRSNLIRLGACAPHEQDVVALGLHSAPVFPSHAVAMGAPPWLAPQQSITTLPELVVIDLTASEPLFKKIDRWLVV